MADRADGAEAINALIELSFFNRLSAEARAELATRAKTKRLKEGEFLFRSGDACNSIFVVVLGGIRVIEFTDTGRRMTIELHTVGDLFGLSALGERRAYPHSAYALTDSQLLVVSADCARNVMSRYADFTQAIIDALIGRVHTAHARIKQLAVESVETRLARALMHFADKIGVPDVESRRVVIEASQQDIAEYCATTVESVNRRLRAWERAGLVEAARNRIDLLRPDLILELIGDGAAVECGPQT